MEESTNFLNLIKKRKLLLYSELEEQYAHSRVCSDHDDFRNAIEETYSRTQDLKEFDFIYEQSQSGLSKSIFRQSIEAAMKSPPRPPRKRPTAPVARRARRRPPAQAAEMPSEEELEQFFTAAEKAAQKRFIDRYNYDITKDVPLEGRFEWVPLKP